ncbi:MAG: hypothetical protein QOF15_412 [Mycobacterium sp.]|nr:hypothetical protein [Mycobacterium sp.]
MSVLLTNSRSLNSPCSRTKWTSRPVQPQNIYSFYLIESLDATVAQWVAYVHVERGLVAR